MRKVINNPAFHYSLLGSLVFLIIILKIGNFHMRFWDESLFAVNTYEMMENGNYFSLYFNKLPDLFNTKPPLFNWVQLISVKIFGYNEFALRLPSGLAASAVVLMLFTFLKRHFSMQYAWIGSLILLSSVGFINYHTARTGDADSLLTCMLMLSIIQFLNFIITEKRIHIFLTILFLLLAFLTKLHAAFLFLPAFLIILIQQKKLKQFMLNYYFLTGVLLFIGLSFIVMYMREVQTPGYLHQIIYKDAGRLFEEVENHGGLLYFYLDSLFTQRYTYWISIFIVGLFLIIFNKDVTQRKILIAVLWLILSYFLIITFSVTKLVWYDMPLFPLFAIIAAYPINQIIERLSLTQLKSSSIIIALFFYPLFLMFRQSQNNPIEIGDRQVEANEMYLYQAFRANENMDQVKVLYHGWNGSLLFYKYKFETIGQVINLHTNSAGFQVGDRILVCEDWLVKELEQDYELELINQRNTAVLYRVK